MAITTYVDFVNNYLIKNGMIGNATNINKAPDQLKRELDSLTTDNNAANILVKLKTVDGAESGLDADLLDGMNTSSTNTASTVVTRDGSGNFSAGTITAALTGNASTATKLATARTINGVSFDGSTNITVGVSDATAVKLTGDQTIAGVKTFSSNIVGNITGNAGTATSLLGDETNWVSYRSRSVANMLGWKKYGNEHCIFDASAGTAPNDVAVNNTNSAVPWSPSYPTLMGWNGSNTHGVRVDSARVAEVANNAIGYGQTWHDVTASRALGVTYTNTTGKPISVSFDGRGSDTGSPQQINITVSGVNVASVANSFSNGGNYQGYTQNLTTIVPHNATYSYNTSTTLQSFTIRELR